MSIDTLDTERLLQVLYGEDVHAVRAASAAAGSTARAVDEAFARTSRGGRVHYFGAGASGRLAMLDATEIRPTFGIEPGQFTFHFPGGTSALVDSAIDLEDSEADGFDDAAGLVGSSVAVGITASGSTPYVAGALRRAREVDSLSVLITCNPGAPLRDFAHVCIVADTGPEALTGSTRLKAGTATKVILNSFSTALMIRSGRVYSNLMVGLVPTNDKLRERALTILVQATSFPREDCKGALQEADGNTPLALICLLTGCSVEVARTTFAKQGSVRQSVAAVSESRR